MLLATPDEFRKIFRNMGQGVSDLAGLDITLAQIALSGVTIEDSVVIRLFLDKLLSQHAAHEVAAWWYNRTSGVYFRDPLNAVEFLKDIRKTLDKPPYSI